MWCCTTGRVKQRGSEPLQKGLWSQGFALSKLTHACQETHKERCQTWLCSHSVPNRCDTHRVSCTHTHTQRDRERGRGSESERERAEVQLLKLVDVRGLRGGMIFTFYKARGLKVGASLVEEDKLDLARELEKIAKEKGVEFILPTDVIVADKFAPDAKTQVVSIDAIPEGWMVSSRSHSFHVVQPCPPRKISDCVFSQRCFKCCIPAAWCSAWCSSNHRQACQTVGANPCHPKSIVIVVVVIVIIIIIILLLIIVIIVVVVIIIVIVSIIVIIVTIYSPWGSERP